MLIDFAIEVAVNIAIDLNTPGIVAPLVHNIVLVAVNKASQSSPYRIEDDPAFDALLRKWRNGATCQFLF
jgi:hypothetical protein